jgi:diphosphate-dependent phosphofructokinase
MRVAMLTAGGLAPCLSSAVGGLIQQWSEAAPDAELVGYRNGYAGLLMGSSFVMSPAARAQAAVLHRHGGSPLGNSRTKLTNRADCEKRGLVQPGEDPLAVAANRLRDDGIDVLHTIGGDDTNITAADLAAYLAANGHQLTVVGLPKTIDNDVAPIRQTLGAMTAAEEGAKFFEHIVTEGSSNPRTLVVHEVMGRNCGWLTAATAQAYRSRVARREVAPAFGLSRDWLDLDAVYLPEMPFDLTTEADRLRSVMDDKGTANIFLSEGAGVSTIVAELEASGTEVGRDAFGHVKIDTINVGQWFSKRFAALISADKTQVQKSGYFARSAPANADDLALIAEMVVCAVDSALAGHPGVIGHDEERGNELRAIEFPRIKGGKSFDPMTPWFRDLLREIGQA